MGLEFLFFYCSDFSNNSLIGPVPEFLAHMTSLKVM